MSLGFLLWLGIKEGQALEGGLSSSFQSLPCSSEAEQRENLPKEEKDLVYGAHTEGF